jgi:predicted Holliday junction resolvase-like endonuclease
MIKYHLFLFTFIVLGLLNATAQINRYSKPIPADVKSSFVPISKEKLNSIRSELNRRQALYDNNKKHIDALIDWVFDLRNKDTDQTFQTQMKKHYKSLRAFDGKDLSLESNSIRNIELAIKEDILDYNNRVKLKNKKKPEEMLAIGTKVTLYSFKGLYKYPNLKSEVVIEIKEGSVELISVCDKGFYKAMYDDYVGYLHYKDIYKIP